MCQMYQMYQTYNHNVMSLTGEPEEKCRSQHKSDAISISLTAFQWN